MFFTGFIKLIRLLVGVPATLQRSFRIFAILQTLTVALGSQAQNPSPQFNVNQNFNLSYPIVFVASRTFCQQDAAGLVTCSNGPSVTYHNGKPDFGNDAGAAAEPTNPSDLYMLLPNKNVIKLFPLPIQRDANILGLGNTSAIGSGAVTEPNISLDGRSVLFTYFYSANPQNQRGPKSVKSDIFRINLGPIIDNPEIAPESLQVVRLTSQPSTSTDVSDALNPTLAGQALNTYWDGLANLHAIEVPWDDALFRDPVYGPIKVVFVSNRRKVRAANGGVTSKNLSLFVADIGENGTLTNINQFFYYTTTAAISPENLRNGFAFSYIGNDKRDQHWEIQSTDTAGVWKPLQGYGSNASNSYHLGTLCATRYNDQQGEHDVHIATSYYTRNVGGFGGLQKISMAAQGLNDSDGNRRLGYRTPKQLEETLITLGVDPIEDYPSPFDPNTGKFVGKYTTPACGGPNELFISYAPSYANSNGLKPCPNANGSNVNPNCPMNVGNYDAKIIFRDNLNPFSGINNEYTAVVDEVSQQVGGISNYSLLWPKPVISMRQRLGGVLPARSIRDVQSQGLPTTTVGTSALYHTDITPPECRYNTNNFSPGRRGDFLSAAAANGVMNNVSLLHSIRSFDLNPNNPDSVCNKPVLPSMVGGVQIVLTDNKTESDYNYFSGNRKERKKILGFYPTGLADQQFNGESDHSFKAIIPARLPFTFQLIDKKYGLSLANSSTWHQGNPGQERSDCGGCHQHDAEQSPIDISNTLAGQSSYVPADFVNQTPVIQYDPQCRPTVEVRNVASVETPFWGNTTPLFQGFVTNCGGCHSAGTPVGLNTFQVFPNNAEASFQSVAPYLSSLIDVNPGATPVSTHLGALGSSAFWAARGERTDGRADCSGSTALDQKYWCFKPDNHRGIGGGPLFCDGTNPLAAKWVYEFGSWIDNNLPREQESPNLDRFHPAVNAALADQANCSIDSGVRVGFWDDTGAIASLTVSYTHLTLPTIYSV